MKKLILLISLGCGVFPLFSQPVIIPIQNALQQNPMWCWAAVAEQTIAYKKNISPKQCELVSQVSKAITTSCCENASICNAPGTMQQIQAALNQFGIKHSITLPITDPLALYNLLAQNHPVVLFLQSSRIVGHCVVITGMDFPGQSSPISNSGFIDVSSSSAAGQPMVYVNDPTSTYIQPLPFSTIVSLWSNAIILN